MGILIGVDEAGYGPNFGPLVVAATAWHVDDAHERTNGSPGFTHGSPRLRPGFNGDAASGAATATAPPTRRRAAIDCVDLYPLLRNIVAKSASERRIAIADSKALYQAGLGLRQLERGIHAVLLSMRQTLPCWSRIVDYCRADPDGDHRHACWPEGFDCPLPIDAAAEETARLAARFARACDAVHVRPLFLRARLVFPGRFNDLIARYGSKGAALSHITVGLLREVVDEVQADTFASPIAGSQAPTFVLCDKHGGRNYYTALLQHHFAEHWVNPVFESHVESRYEWGPPGARVRATFRMNGEKFLPTALASMTAKYLRELAMRAFNQFWCAHIPDLRPTAGYPTDSHRFHKAIQAKQRELAIDDHLLWRRR